MIYWFIYFYFFKKLLDFSLLGGSNTLNRVETNTFCFIGWGYPYLSSAVHLDFTSLNSCWIAKRKLCAKKNKVYFPRNSMQLQIFLKNVINCHFWSFFKAMNVCSLYFPLNGKFEIEQTLTSQLPTLVPLPFSSTWLWNSEI